MFLQYPIIQDAPPPTDPYGGELIHYVEVLFLEKY